MEVISRPLTTTNHPKFMSTPLTPKGAEIIAYYGGGQRKVEKLPSWYEVQMARAFKEKQLMQGLLNQKDGLVEATRQGELF